MVRQTFLHKLHFRPKKVKLFVIAIFGLVIIGSNISKGNDLSMKKDVTRVLFEQTIWGLKYFDIVP